MDKNQKNKIGKEMIDQIQTKLIEWEKDNYDFFPWRETNNDFHALIAEVMLQRTNANQVLNVYNEFTYNYPTLKSAAAAEKNEMRSILSPLGLNWRNENILKLIDELSRLDKIPDEYDKLRKLPGVGDYISSAYLSFHKDKRFSIIDSNAIRLWGRIFGLNTGPNSRRNKNFKSFIIKITPETNHRQFNLAVLDLSRKVCKKQPIHSICPVKHICEYNK